MQKVLSLMQKDQKRKQLDIVPIVKGSETTASGAYSHAEGKHTIALGGSSTCRRNRDYR